jgi:hypothetical protein
LCSRNFFGCWLHLNIIHCGSMKAWRWHNAVNLGKFFFQHYALQNKGVDWIQLAHDRDQWRVLVNTIIIFHLFKTSIFTCGNFRLIRVHHSIYSMGAGVAQSV